MSDQLQWIIPAAALIAAALSIYKYFSQVVHFMDRQKKQEEEIKAIKDEQTLIIYGLLACLKGLNESDSNGPVHEAIDKIEKHINQKAHA